MGVFTDGDNCKIVTKKAPKPDHVCGKGVIPDLASGVVKTYTPKFRPIDDDSSENSMDMVSTWEKLKEPITAIGVGILYFVPIVGTIYSGIQLAKPCFKTHSPQVEG